MYILFNFFIGKIESVSDFNEKYGLEFSMKTTADNIKNMVDIVQATLSYARLSVRSMKSNKEKTEAVNSFFRENISQAGELKLSDAEKTKRRIFDKKETIVKMSRRFWLKLANFKKMYLEVPKSNKRLAYKEIQDFVYLLIVFFIIKDSDEKIILEFLTKISTFDYDQMKLNYLFLKNMSIANVASFIKLLDQAYNAKQDESGWIKTITEFPKEKAMKYVDIMRKNMRIY
jgi:hypothetical protein